MIRRDFAFGHYVSQIMDALRKDLAFAEFDFQSRFDELSQGYSENRQELSELKCIHQQVVEVRRYVFSDLRSENAIHQALERRGDIAQTKGCVIEYEKALVCNKRWFWSVLDANRDLVISHQQVEGNEAMCVEKVRKDFIDARQRVLVLHGLLIELPIVHAHPESSNFLWHYYDGAWVGTNSRIRR